MKLPDEKEIAQIIEDAIIEHTASYTEQEGVTNYKEILAKAISKRLEKGGAL